MWYVIQVVAGDEQKICSIINNGELKAREIGLEPALDECFVPRYQVERKFHGEYKVLERNLFPGYIVAVTNNIDLLNARLTHVPKLTRILGSEKAFVPLDPAEQALINSYTTDKHRVVRISRAVDEGDGIVVMEGPLVGKEGQITKINRRKGTCQVTFQAFGRTLSVEMGLAVVSKTKES